MKNYQKITLKTLYFLATVLVLSALAFYNKFPLLYPDSGTYLYNSSSLDPSVDKAMGYSLFIHLVTWQATTWTIVLFQNIIVTYLIFMFLKLFFKGNQLYKIHFTTIISLTLFSSLCWFSCLIMPDIFTSAMVLVVILFICSEKISAMQSIVYLLLLFIFLISHLSNLILLNFILLLLIAFLFIKKRPENTIRIMKRRSYILFVTALFSVLFIMTYNFRQGLGFKTSPTSHVLLIAKFCNTGLLKRYLDDNCKSGNENVLCQYKDSLPVSSDAFLWGDRSPLYEYHQPETKDEPWLKADVLYAPIVNDILYSPAYYPKLAGDAVVYTWQQMIAIKIATGKIPFGINSAPYYPYRDKFPKELNSFMNSRQNRGILSFEPFELFNRFSVLLSLLIILTGLLYVKPDFILWLSTALIALSLLSNAFITSFLSVVEDRYQSRIVWLLPLLAIVYLALIIKRRRGLKE